MLYCPPCTDQRSSQVSSQGSRNILYLIQKKESLHTFYPPTTNIGVLILAILSSIASRKFSKKSGSAATQRNMGVKSDDDIMDMEGGNNENVTLLPSSTGTNAGPVSKRSSAATTARSTSERATRKVKRLRKKKMQVSDSPIVKYGSLCLLVAQLVGLVMLMRYSRTHSNGDLYLPTTAVFCMEVSFAITYFISSYTFG